MANEDFSDDINNLLKEFKISKDKLEDYITQVETMKGNITDIFPKQLDYRNKHLMDDKLRIFTEFFNTLLKLRQEKHKMILDEIKIRTPKKQEEKDFDIRSIMKEINKEQKNGN